jgi:hypothetical protein
VFEVADLERHGIENLTDNGEAEIRVKKVPDWDRIVKRVYIIKKPYETGDGWEEFFYRPIKEWLPDRLKSMVTVETTATKLGKLIDKEYPNHLK